jgi:hypothetical protein
MLPIATANPAHPNTNLDRSKEEKKRQIESQKGQLPNEILLKHGSPEANEGRIITKGIPVRSHRPDHHFGDVRQRIAVYERTEAKHKYVRKQKIRFWCHFPA